MREWTDQLRARLAPLHLPPTREAAIIDELSQHLDDRCRELEAAGASPDDARRATLAELTEARLLAPRLAALHRSTVAELPQPAGPARRRPFTGLWQDLRYAGRTLGRQPVFTLVAVLTLALGIGLNTAMFSLVNMLLLRPLPFPNVAQLVRVYQTTQENQRRSISPADYVALDRDGAGFGRFAAYQPSSLGLDEPTRASEWLLVTSDFFDVLGVAPTLGRSFRPDEEIVGHHRVVLISQGLWHDRFASAADVLGQTVTAAGETYEIIGVLPEAASDHRLFGRVGLFSPLALSAERRADRRAHSLTVLARRDPAVSVAQGEAFLTSFGARLATEYPAENANSNWRSEGLPESATGPTGRAIVAMILGLSGCVLLIACSNLANLLLARTIDRTREFAVRAALGASRLQLTRTLVFEALLLALMGGAAALLVATWTTTWLRSIIVNSGGPAFVFPLDWRVLGFAAAAALLTLVFCGTLPALFASRINTNATLKAGGRGSAGSASSRVRHALLVVQFALAMTLLAGAGFFARGMANLLGASFGWDANRVAQAEFSLPSERYPDDGRVLAFYQQVVQRTQQLPGVESASISYGLPYLGLRGFGRFAADREGPNAAALPVLFNGVSPSYFDVTGTRLLAGRPFGDVDGPSSPAVAIVSQGLASALYPGENPVGRRVKGADAVPVEWLEIVGVVEDVRPIDVAERVSPYQLYQPITQDPRRDATLAVRTTGAAAETAISAMRRTLLELDEDLVARNVMPATAKMEREATSAMSMVQQLLTAFAVTGLLLAALGIYGTMMRMVSQRTAEIGLRMALGAQIANVIGLVLRSGLRIVATGAAIGVVGATALGRLLASVLPGMQTNSVLVSAAAIIGLMAIALVACYLPARRAASVDPIVALRSE